MADLVPRPVDLQTSSRAWPSWVAVLCWSVRHLAEHDLVGLQCTTKTHPAQWTTLALPFSVEVYSLFPRLLHFILFSSVSQYSTQKLECVLFRAQVKVNTEEAWERGCSRPFRPSFLPMGLLSLVCKRVFALAEYMCMQVLFCRNVV